MKIVLTFFIFLIAPCAFAQKMSRAKFREQYIQASDLSLNGNYIDALPLWLELEKAEPKNASIQFAIGDCYMHSTYEKIKSIEYFEAAEGRISLNYSPGNPSENSAPIETMFYLARAYHLNYEFIKAIDKFQEFKDVVGSEDRNLKKTIEREMEICRNGIEAVKDPVDISIRMAYDMNSIFPEYRAVVNADETQMILTARKDDSNGGGKDLDGKYYEDLYVSYKVRGIWTKPIHLDGAINSEEHDASMYLSPAGDHLLLYRDDGKTMGGSIYESFLHGNKWSNPDIMLGKMNSKAWETHACLSADQKTMVFTSDRTGGIGGKDLWICSRDASGNWGMAKPVPGGVNTKFDEESPYLHPDGKSLYFSSRGHNTMGGYDIFVAILDEKGDWGNVRNIGYPINTTGNDIFFVPTANGKRAYFSSFREGGKGDQDIYIMELNSEEEKTLTIYKGLATDSDGAVVKNLVITVFDKETDDLFGVYKPNPTTGKFLFILRPGHTYSIEYEVNGVIQTETVKVDENGGVNQVGRLVVKEKDGIHIHAKDVEDLDILEMTKRRAAGGVEMVELDVYLTGHVAEKDHKLEEVIQHKMEEDAKVKLTDILDHGGKIVLDGVLFEYNEYKLTHEAKAKIDYLYDYLVKHDKAVLKITGYTDSKGGHDFNVELSTKRAKAVRDYLKDKGISKKRLHYEGLGEANRLEIDRLPNGDYIPEAMEKNRRVEFEIEH